MPISIAQKAGTSPEFPPDWDDDARMSFLFSAFKANREVDPNDWDGKMNFWTPLVVQSCRQRGSVCMNLQELNECFRRKGTVPMGLSTVLQSMIRSGKVQKESDFAANVDSGWLSWGVGLLLVRPLKWTLSALLGSGRVPLEESFVIIELVKEKATALMAAYRSSPLAGRSLLSFQELRSFSSHICPDETTLCLALLQLQREKHVTVSLHEEEKLVKFSQAGQGRVSPVSEVDLGIYQLQRSKKLLEERVEALGQEVEECKEQAKTLLKEGKRSQLCDTQDEVNQTLASGALDSTEGESEELEEELKALMEDGAPDTSLTLPDVPHQPVSSKDTSVLDDAFLKSLPSVPDTNITDEELERELSRLSLISISCLFPASWHFSFSPALFPRFMLPSFRQLLLLGSVVVLVGLLYLLLVTGKGQNIWFQNKHYHRHLSRVTDTEATDTTNPNLNYGVVVDCGSSGSRVFVYTWPRHNGNPHDLLDIRQMRDQNRKPVVMKIKPGISEYATTPGKASDYMYPLLSFAAEHIPRTKHQETPLYILCTAGMRVLPESQQEALLEDLRTDIPVNFNFLFSDSHVEVISGKQEGVYAWIGINFVLGRFNHVDDDDDEVVEVQVPGGDQQETLVRRRTAGVLDMGGVSTQIAYEVPKTEEVAKNLLAEFNLGCDAHRTEHVYRVYVSTFLGFGGNAARQRYEENLVSSTRLQNKLLDQHRGETSDAPVLDPCLPSDLQDEVGPPGQKLHLRGSGDFDQCRLQLQPFLNRTNETSTSLNGVYQAPIDFPNSQFYGFSEFYYCTEDVLRMGGDYNSTKYANAAKDYCATQWKILRERFDRGLYASHADLHRLKYQCFKSAWVYEVFHAGFSFPVGYESLKTALLVYDKEVQWTLGAILYRTRFLPLRDIQQESLKGSHSHWHRGFTFMNNHYLFLACFLVVLLSIMLYVLRLRRIHRRAALNRGPSVQWLEEGLGSPDLPVTL
ncbi:Ectonucleoside triphosphate diphosphohydrolase 4 [Bagarius yarrelli]|uniref:nucleoside-triphosphate phosphatase n=1 Tax=Bagarius yarrelli TaxID=175774 RepID=A0A556UFT2_BAGYA|nr:Ectonucleoside triphosphate diphosphohydrolase 4 [Bagarius yarrelli]